MTTTARPLRAGRFPATLAPPLIRRLGLADIAILCLLGGAIAAVVAFAREFEAPLRQTVQIDLSAGALPRYTMYSLARGTFALVISYLFALGFGWVAAKSTAAERVLLPLLDILQSIPVLGFLPGLVLGLMALFPTRNVGLELAAILMIFTAQAWNLAWSFYNSVKSLPEPLRDASTMAGWGARRVFWRLELPAAAQGLVWNGMLSMAGGWFFLMVNEAFRLGGRDYRLPGIGSYMSVALDQGNVPAMVRAIIAMIVMILCVDQVLWRPLVAWVERFRLDDTAGTPMTTNWLLTFFRRARIPRRFAAFRRSAFRTARRATEPIYRVVAQPVIRNAPRVPGPGANVVRSVALGAVAVVIGGIALLGAWKLVLLLRQLSFSEWLMLVGAGGLTFIRVMVSVLLSTAWAVPVGVVLGRSPRLSRVAQPIIQVVASFPAPMLFPIVILALGNIGVGLGWGAIALMVLSGQFYILFNVISAVAAIPEQLKEASTVFQLSPMARWRSLYLPAAFPALVTGWTTAAGGAWNGSIVAEYLVVAGQLRTTQGLGSLISEATAHANFPLLAGGIALMSAMVVSWNRVVWRPLMRWSHDRFALV